MYLPVRTTLAVLTLTLFGAAGAAQAAPVTLLDSGSSLVIAVVDDSTNESDALEIEENKLPNPEGSKANDPSPSMGAQPSGGDDNEATQLKDEKSDN